MKRIQLVKTSSTRIFQMYFLRILIINGLDVILLWIKIYQSTNSTPNKGIWILQYESTNFSLYYIIYPTQ